jgi:hypothetical protein
VEREQEKRQQMAAGSGRGEADFSIRTRPREGP